MVVVPEPAVKGCGAFSVGAVDRAVGPAGEHRADEAFGFAVGLRAARPGAQVTDIKRAAGKGVDRGAIRRSVVGQDALDGDAVTCEELDRATEKPDRARGLLIVEDLGVSEAGGVVDGDVNAVPAGA